MLLFLMAIPFFLLPLAVFGIGLLWVARRREEILLRIKQSIDNREFVATNDFDFNNWVSKTRRRVRRSMLRGVSKVLLGSLILYVSILLSTISLKMVYFDASTSYLPYGTLFLGFMLMLYCLVYFFERCAHTQFEVRNAIDASIFFHFPFANRAFEVHTGELNPSYWGDGRIIEGLKYLQDKGVRLRIYCHDPRDHMFYDDANARNKVLQEVIRPYHDKNIGSALRSVQLPSNGKRHYMIARVNVFGLTHDVIRLEDRHEKWWKRESPQTGVRNSLYFCNLPLSIQLRSDIRELESKSLPVSYTDE